MQTMEAHLEEPFERVVLALGGCSGGVDEDDVRSELVRPQNFQRLRLDVEDGDGVVVVDPPNGI